MQVNLELNMTSGYQLNPGENAGHKLIVFPGHVCQWHLHL